MSSFAKVDTVRKTLSVMDGLRELIMVRDVTLSLRNLCPSRRPRMELIHESPRVFWRWGEDPYTPITNAVTGHTSNNASHSPLHTMQEACFTNSGTR